MIFLFFFQTSFLSAQVEASFFLENENLIILYQSTIERPQAELLQRELESLIGSPVTTQISEDIVDGYFVKLKIESNWKDSTYFKIEPEGRGVLLLADSELHLTYAVSTFLEGIGIKNYTPNFKWYPEFKDVTVCLPKQNSFQPDFEYRAILYPDAYNSGFRDWHKLDWHLDDFGVWGHSFYIIIPPEKYFIDFPELFALYEGERRPESLCMTHPEVHRLAKSYYKNEILAHPTARFFSISQNDDIVYCQCTHCQKINDENGGPTGSLYHFVNAVAEEFPDNQFVTLAYQHTVWAPSELAIRPNVITMYCPIEANRGQAIGEDERSKSIGYALDLWKDKNPNLFVWDYTVQFSNFLSPFPNFHVLQKNMQYFKAKGVKGMFVQGYADVPGDFYELRQYLLSKLLWDVNLDFKQEMGEFIHRFYGGAAKYVSSYLQLLEEMQLKENRILDIYSNPIIQSRSFLAPNYLNQYDSLISLAEFAVQEDSILRNRVAKIRYSLEYAHFQQAKFYGKNIHGMFKWDNGKWQVPESLSKRVSDFANDAADWGVYELSEAGMSPGEYKVEWDEISETGLIPHKGENLQVSFLVQPSPEYRGSGPSDLLNGIRGFKNFNIQWLGWYDDNPDIIIKTNRLRFESIEVGFLEDQRHWIFPPEGFLVYGRKGKNWKLLGNVNAEQLKENYDILRNVLRMKIKRPQRFKEIRITIQNQSSLPSWRYRKNKKPMVMVDEISFH